MNELLIGGALLLLGLIALAVARKARSSTLASSDSVAMGAALTITTMISIGIGLLATGIYLIVG